MVKGVLITNDGKVEVKEVSGELDDYYEILNCRCFDIATRRIGEDTSKHFDIFCDDEGLLIDNPKPTGLDWGMQPMLFGNLFVVQGDGEGNTISLTEEEIKYVLSNIRTVFVQRKDDPDFYEIRKMLCYLDY